MEAIGHGRSPGLRINIADRLPDSQLEVSGNLAGNSPLTVAGAAAALLRTKARNDRIPFSPSKARDRCFRFDRALDGGLSMTVATLACLTATFGCHVFAC
jgi:hypothetical protein